MDYIDDLEKAEENRDILKGFFSVLKDSDPYLRFFLITGVSKFSKVSLFSDLNNLEDITLAPSAATLTGYTQAELEHHFEEPFREMAKAEEQDYPTLEVKDTMRQHLLAAFRQTPVTDSQPVLIRIKRALDKGDLEHFIELVNTLFASIPHQIFLQRQEAFFHAILHLAFSGIGLLVQSEVSTAKGRADTIVHTKNRTYVMEFKLDGSAGSALQQIREKRYGSPFPGKDKEVIALGINFSSADKEVAEWQAVPYEELLVEG